MLRLSRLVPPPLASHNGRQGGGQRHHWQTDSPLFEDGSPQVTHSSRSRDASNSGMKRAHSLRYYCCKTCQYNRISASLLLGLHVLRVAPNKSTFPPGATNVCSAQTSESRARVFNRRCIMSAGAVTAATNQSSYRANST